MNEKTSPELIKKSQKQLALIILMVIGIVLAGIYYLASDAKSGNVTLNGDKSNFVTPVNDFDGQSLILERTQKQLAENEKKTEKLNQQLESLIQKKNEGENTLTLALANKLNELENQLKTFQSASNTNTVNQANASYPANDLPFNNTNAPENISDVPTIREDRLTLRPSIYNHKKPQKNPDTYVPAGTFVKAVILGGADAAASVTAQSNPKVTLLRIIENGTLPNHRKSHLKNCVVVARVTGDISSERGSISAERLSCVFPNNEIVEQKVIGIVFGPDGKVDVRGNVHEGGGQYVGRAFAAGTLSGLSEGLSQTFTANSISPEGNVQTVNSGKVFQYGAAKGVGKTMDRMADYQIKKAEQFHPVIQLSAGTVVDVVFQVGFYLDGKEHEDREKNELHDYTDSTINTPTLFSSNDSNLKNLPLSQNAINKYEQYSNELNQYKNKEGSA